MRNRLGNLIGRLRQGVTNVVNRVRGRSAAGRGGGRSSGT